MKTFRNTGKYDKMNYPVHPSIYSWTNQFMDKGIQCTMYPCLIFFLKNNMFDGLHQWHGVSMKQVKNGFQQKYTDERMDRCMNVYSLASFHKCMNYRIHQCLDASMIVSVYIFMYQVMRILINSIK
jgi:hypothetical protein